MRACICRRHARTVPALVAAVLLVLAGVALAPSVASAQTDASSPPARANTAESAPDRGSMFAEIVGGGGGILVSAAGLNVKATIAVGVANIFVPADLYSRLGYVALASTGVSVILGPGMGSYLGGYWTGGTGRLGPSILGSTIGGLGGLVVFGGLGILHDSAIRSGDVAFVSPLLLLSPILVSATAITGGVVGYRNSARAPRTTSADLQFRPILAPTPRADGGVVGISVDF